MKTVIIIAIVIAVAGLITLKITSWYKKNIRKQTCLARLPNEFFEFFKKFDNGYGPGQLLECYIDSEERLFQKKKILKRVISKPQDVPVLIDKKEDWLKRAALYKNVFTDVADLKDAHKALAEKVEEVIESLSTQDLKIFVRIDVVTFLRKEISGKVITIFHVYGIYR